MINIPRLLLLRIHSRKRSLQWKIFTYILVSSLLFSCSAFILVSKVFFANYVDNLTENAVNTSARPSRAWNFC